MSRSYRKGYSGHCSTYGDKWCRFQYHKSLRAKDHRILKECEQFYRDCKLFEPYEECCGLNGEVCDVDVDWYYLELDDPHDKAIYDNNLINPEEILCNVHSKRMNKCIGCYYSENCWKDGEFFDAWEASPDEQFCDNRIDHSVRYSDKWSWASDGGVYYQESIESMRIDFDKEIFGEENNRYSHTNAWEDYCKYRDRKLNNIPCTWKLTYDIFPRIIMESVCDNRTYSERVYPPDNEWNRRYKVIPSPYGNWKEVYYTQRVWERKRVTVELDHRPTYGDLPKGAELVSVYKANKWLYSQARGDYDLMEFLFYRNIIPTTFKSREEMNEWLLKHEEMIVHKWYRIKNRK